LLLLDLEKFLKKRRQALRIDSSRAIQRRART
jgi:hypothetical protein